MRTIHAMKHATEKVIGFMLYAILKFCSQIWYSKLPTKMWVVGCVEAQNVAKKSTFNCEIFSKKKKKTDTHTHKN